MAKNWPCDMTVEEEERQTVATYDAVMDELRDAGTAQNVKIYRRHGVTGDLFGVSYARLNALKKRIKTDHDLATALWASGNHDARILATMIADPTRATPAGLDAWLAGADNSTVVAALTRNVAGRLKPPPWELVERWTASNEEWTGAAGWDLLTVLAMTDTAHDDAYYEARLAEIERRIGGSANRVRYEMNNAVIAIGGRNPALAAAATAAAGRIGRVEVDHGETGCKTPEAAAYIERIWARKRPAA
jgi:3-methyladenine DNA glycosylase AlkD